MSFIEKKKSKSWHTKTKPNALDSKISNLILNNNKSIFSEILKAKLSSQKDQGKISLKSETQNTQLKFKEKEETPSNYVVLPGVLNHTFSRFNKCNFCGSNSFYERSKLKADVNEMMLTNSISKKSISLQKNKKYRLSMLDSANKSMTYSLSTSSKAALSNYASIKNDSIINENDSPIYIEEKPMKLQTNFFQEYIPQQIMIKNNDFNKIFEKNLSFQSPIENNISQSMASLKKDLPTAFSNKTMSRKEILILKNWFYNQEEILNKKTFQNLEEKTNRYFELYSVCLNEIIKEISLECSEKGEIINDIWQKFLNLMASHKFFIDEEIKNYKEKSKKFKENCINEQKIISEKDKLLIEEKNNQILELKMNIREMTSQIQLLERKNKTYWEESNKYRYLSKKTNDSYVILKKEYQNLEKKVYQKSKMDEKTKNPEIFVNNESEEKILNPNIENDIKNANFKKKTREFSNNFKDFHTLNDLKNEKIEDSKTIMKTEKPQQMNSTDFDNNKVQNKQNSISIFTSSKENQLLLNEALEKELQNRDFSSERNLLKKKINKGTQYNELHFKKFQDQHKKTSLKNLVSKDSSSESHDSFLSRLEICDDEKQEKLLIKFNELNNLVTMVHPDKFKLAMFDKCCQEDYELYDSYHKNQTTQTKTNLLESKFDLVFSKNKEIIDFLNEYTNKKEIEKLCAEKNLLDLKVCNDLGQQIEEMIEESLQANENFNEMQNIFDQNNASPSEKNTIKKNNFENEIHELKKQIKEENFEEISPSQDIAVTHMKKGIELTNQFINSPSLKFKTMTKIREFLLKVLKVYFKENSKNIIFGKEIRNLSEKLKQISHDKLTLEEEMDEIKKKIEYISINNPTLFQKNMVDSDVFKDLDIEEDDEEYEDEDYVDEKGMGRQRKKRKVKTFSFRHDEKTEQTKVKSSNPGPQLILQIKSKNISKFQNILSMKMIYKTILQVYQDRITLIKENPKIKEVDCPSFLYNFFIKCYGFRKMAQQKFIIFLLSLKKFNTQLRVNIFAKFLGLLQTSMNYTIEEFNQYISGLDFIFYNSGIQTNSNTQNLMPTSTIVNPTNSENESRFMVNFVRVWEYVKISFEKESEINAEFTTFKKEMESLKEEDPKNYLKSGIIDYDLFMSHYLPFFRKTKNQNKINLVTAFNAADLNLDGFVDYFEFNLIVKYIEKNFFLEHKEDGIEKLFKEYADIVIGEDEKHLSFNNFCYFCEEYNIFEIKKLYNFLDLEREEEIYNKLVSSIENWKYVKKEALYKMNEFKNKEFWIECFKKLDAKLETGLKDHKTSFSSLISLNLIKIQYEHSLNQALKEKIDSIQKIE